jgi:hypothetical protein
MALSGTHFFSISKLREEDKVETRLLLIKEQTFSNFNAFKSLYQLLCSSVNCFGVLLGDSQFVS